MVVSTSPGLAIHGKAFRLSKAALLIGCADRATCVLADCACRPWRNFGGFDQPRPCHPWQGVQAFKSCAFDRLRRPAFTHPWRGHGGFDQPLSRHPLSSRSSGHRAQLGGARSAHEAALRKRLPSPLEKRCFSSAAPTGQLAFWRIVRAVPWRNFGGFDQPLSRHPCRAVRPLKSCAFHRLRRPGNLRSGGLCVPSLAQLWRLRPTPVSTSLSSRSALEKLRFSSAAPTGPHPVFLHLVRNCFILPAFALGGANRPAAETPDFNRSKTG